MRMQHTEDVHSRANGLDQLGGSEILGILFEAQLEAAHSVAEAIQMPWDGPPFAFAGDSVQGVDRKTACCGGGPRDGNPRRVKGEKDD